ncbi:MAG: hypothetical protein WA020_03020 [Candidatus Acidiferrales bacterium]
MPLTPLVANTLWEWRLACPATKLDLVFPNENGGIHSNTNLHRHYWDVLQSKLGMVTDDGKPRYVFHALRHVAVSLFIEQG